MVCSSAPPHRIVSLNLALEVSIPATPQRSCISCRRTADRRISLPIATAIFLVKNIICNSREHRLCSSCRGTALHSLNIPSKKSQATKLHVQTLIQMVKARGLNFFSMTDNQRMVLTGLTHDSLHQVSAAANVEYDKLCGIMSYLRLGIGQRPISVLLGISQQAFSKRFRNLLPELSNAMSKAHLRRERSDVLQSAIPFFRAIFPNMIAFADGTYHQCEKSQVFSEQLKSYSSQKGYNLVKTLSLLGVDGRWWDLLGLFYSDANHNDEMIYEYIMQNNVGDVHSLIDESAGDSVVVDRCSSRFHFLLCYLHLLQWLHSLSRRWRDNYSHGSLFQGAQAANVH